MVKYSIIVPTHNRAELLAEALRSVLEQTISDWECLIVDDCGDVDMPVPKDDRFRLLKTASNGGSAIARNVGLTQARGEYVTFLDDDDLYAPSRLAVVDPLVSNDHVVVCGSSILGEVNGGASRELTGDVRNTILDSFVPHLGTVTVPRARCPLFAEEFRASQDVEWWLRLAQVLEVQTIQEVGYHYRRHGGIRHRSGAASRAEFGIELLRKHQYYFDAHPRARAFREERIAVLYVKAGHTGQALRYAARAVHHDFSATRLISVGKSLVVSLRTRNPGPY